MPPVCVGAIMHSMRRTGSGMSKWLPERLAITSSALWLLIQEGKVSPDDLVVKYVPEYGTNGKETTTLEHLLIHTAGIPVAPGSFKDWGDHTRRLQRFAQWRPDNPPGEKFIYHIHANYWPIAEAIERITGKRIGEFVRERIAQPLGLPDLRIGLPRPLQGRMADVASAMALES